jgi:choline/glycine/proline betaine transport protein
MTKNEIIADALREYERVISLVSDKKNELLVIEK